MIAKRIFIDTNILVYLADSSDLDRQNKTREILKKDLRDNHLIISTQVIQEFFITATKKLSIDSLQAKEIIKSFLNMEVVTVVPEIILNSIDILVLNKVSFWDSLIVASAQFANCSIIYSEDMQNNQKFGNTKIVNPL